MQEKLLQELNEKVRTVYVECGFESDAKPTTLTMLTDLEGKLEFLLAEMETMDKEYVEGAEKVRLSEGLSTHNEPTHAHAYVYFVSSHHLRYVFRRKTRKGASGCAPFASKRRRRSTKRGYCGLWSEQRRPLKRRRSVGQWLFLALIHAFALWYD